MRRTSVTSYAIAATDSTAEEEVVSLTGAAWHGGGLRADQQWSRAECGTVKDARRFQPHLLCPLQQVTMTSSGSLKACWQTRSPFRTIEATRRIARNCLPRHMTLWRSLKASQPP